MSLVALAPAASAFATTPIAVDMYQDMESGNAGDVLTTAIMNASAHPSSGWTQSQRHDVGFDLVPPGPARSGHCRRDDLQRHRRLAKLDVQG